MAFIVEDGTGLSTANAGISVSDATVYHNDRGNSLWVGSATLFQQAIVRATDYIELRFAHRFKGIIEFAEQSLSFPRLYLYDTLGNPITGVPLKYKYAVAEYALRSLSSPLFVEPIVDDRGMRVTSVKEQVGPILTSTQYAERINKEYPLADKYLRDYLINMGSVIRG